MAYVSKELKTNITNNIKAKAKEMGFKLKFTAKVEHHSRLIINITAFGEDILANNINRIQEVLDSDDNYRLLGSDRNKLEAMLINNMGYNPIKNVEEYKGGLDFTLNSLIYNQDSNLALQFSGDVLEMVKMVKQELERYNYDNSDAMTDYFDVGYYTKITIGNTKTGIKVL